MAVNEKAVVIDRRDNVATALADLNAGDEIRVLAGESVLTMRIRSAVPFGHKFSLYDLEVGSAVVKYGETIGTATAAIRAGDHVHVHNVASRRGRGDLSLREA